MYIRPEDSKNFPELALLIENLIFIVAKKPKVRAALERYAGGPHAFAILYPQGPTVRIDKDFFTCETDGDPEKQPDGSYIQKYKMKDAFTVPSTKVDEIYLAPDIAKNAGTADGKLLAEAVLLHECVHWCRKIDDKDVYSETEPYAFEREAYGRVMSRNYEVCAPAHVLTGRKKAD